MVSIGSGKTPVSLRFENCRSIGDGNAGLYIHLGNNPEHAVTGSVAFVDCTIERAGGAGVLVIDKPADGCAVSLARCRIIDPGVGNPTYPPAVFMATSESTRPLGGITFDDVLIRDARGGRPMALIDMAGGIGLRGVWGHSSSTGVEPGKPSS